MDSTISSSIAFQDNLTLTLPFTIFVKDGASARKPIFCLSNARLFLLRQALAIFGLKGVNMKAIIISISIILASTFPASAQYSAPFLKVDTVTAGECDDLHPVLDKDLSGSGSSDIQWLAFERRTSDESTIAVKKYFPDATTWDTSVTIVSRSPLPDEEGLPQILKMNSYRGNSWPWMLAWQRKTSNVWNIYYSLYKNDSSVWSQPTALTNDSVSNTNVQARQYRDSTVIIAWKKKNIILYTFMTPSSVKPPDTLAVSSFDSLEFDFGFESSEGGVVWTSRDTGASSFIIKRRIVAYPSFTLTTPETLSLRGRLSHPQFANQWSGYYGPVLYEICADKNHEIFVWDGQNATNLSKDPNADSRNVKTFKWPVITASNNRPSEFQYFWYDVLVMEKNFARDSFLVFQRSAYYSDTLSGPGRNRDACIASWMQYIPEYFSGAALVVWESNRTGRSHIYSRFVLVPIVGVKEENEFAQNFALMQNYPNPFNPTTIIRFHVSTPGFVSLKIFDILGREVETLVDEKLTAGGFSTTWDGKNFPSGVYFYRLQAGHFAETKKLILLK